MKARKRKTLADELAGLSDDELAFWASDVIDGIGDREAMALHIAGWKIV